VRLCEPRLYDQGPPDSSSLGKDEDKANLLMNIPLAAIQIDRTLL
jgi:hypothetical protein